MTNRVLIASSTLLSLPAIEAIRRIDKWEVVGLLSTPDRAKGRHGTASPNEIVSALQPTGMAIYKPVDQEELLRVLEEIKPDLVLVIAYGRLIKSPALEIPIFGWVNLHFSLLPAYRGAAPVQRTLLNQETVFGISFFKIDEGMDTGPLILQKRVKLVPDLPATDVLQELSREGGVLLPEVLERLAKGEPLTPQSGQPSYAPKISKEELRLNIERTDREVLSQVLAFTRRPGVWFTFLGRRHIITEARSSEISIPSGRVAMYGERALIGTRGLAFEIARIIPEGKREISGIEWLRGLHFRDGHVSETELFA